ncbi:MAG TPA: hypothetical protein VMT58_02265, partial [Candidatus Binataceae bacterium]|nr:hypothetical protein [Candidatus Binataceae bacterium]
MSLRSKLRPGLAAAAGLLALTLAVHTAFAGRGEGSDLDSELSSLEGQMGAAQSSTSAASDVITRLDAAGTQFAKIASGPKANKAELAPMYDRLESMLSRMYQTWDKKRQDCIDQI